VRFDRCHFSKLAEAAKEDLLVALKQSEATFRQLADAMPQIVWAAKTRWKARLLQSALV